LYIRTTQSLPISLSNIGDGVCRLTKATIQGTIPIGNKVFSFDVPIKFPLIIMPQKQVSLSIVARPNINRSLFKGEVHFSDGSPEGSATILLVGMNKLPCLEVVPRVLDFGSAKEGCTSTAHEIKVYHLGLPHCPRNIAISSISLAKGMNNEFKFSQIFQRTYVSAKKPFVLNMLYKAKDLGADVGTLHINTDFLPQSPLTVSLLARGVLTEQQRDTFQQIREPQADILFIVDDSGSMQEEQKSLAGNFQSFIKWAVSLHVNYHIGVTTTDITGRHFPAGCLHGYPRFIDRNTISKETKFSQNIRVGTLGSPLEKGFEAAYRALSLPTRENPNCNKGFYRPDASLSLIFVSDEKEQSPQSYEFYLNFFKNLKGIREMSLIRASVVVGPPPNGCHNTGTGRATAAPKYWQLASDLGGIRASICAANWGKTVSQLGSVSFGYRRQFYLSRKPDIRSLIVKVNGKLIPEHHLNGWVFDKVSNSILFSKSKTPLAGAVITVDYRSICF